MRGTPARHEGIFNVGNTATEKLDEAYMLFELHRFCLCNSKLLFEMRIFFGL